MFDAFRRQPGPTVHTTARAGLRRWSGPLITLVVAVTLAGCTASPPSAGVPISRPLRSSSAIGAPAPSTASAPAAHPPTPKDSRTPATGSPAKVLVIAEENHSYGQIIGNSALPYLNTLATTYGSATNMEAGYPARCPSLAAYILLTSGSTHGICDDNDPSAHPLTGDNIFAQIVAAGRQWRNYAESETAGCTATNAGGRFLVRHTPSVYYVSEASRCRNWDAPLGSPTSGALHTDISHGTLPAYGFISPDACDDMHGASECPTGSAGIADIWLRTWMPLILAGPDYRSGHLVVIITWDEGTSADNHIPTIVISPTTHRIQSATRYTHCSTLRTTEEVLHLPLLGCAASAPSMQAGFQITAASP